MTRLVAVYAGNELPTRQLLGRDMREEEEIKSMSETGVFELCLNPDSLFYCRIGVAGNVDLRAHTRQLFHVLALADAVEGLLFREGHVGNTDTYLSQ